MTEKKNLTWSKEMDFVLVDSLLEKMDKGKEIGDTFTNTAFTTVAYAESIKENAY